MNSINDNLTHDLDPHSDHSSDHFTHRNPNSHTVQPQPESQSRRPRGFAAAAASPMGPMATKGKREREKEKERTKLRERHRRAITSRMLAGLRQYGNFPLPARADMNDVLAALAREAGWTVEADGTTYRQSPPPSHLTVFPTRAAESPISASTLKTSSSKVTLDCQPSILRIDKSLSPASFDSVVIAGRESKSEKYTSTRTINSVECLDADQLIRDIRSEEHDSDYTGTPYIPVYVVLAAGIVNNFCQLIDPEAVRQEIRYMKSLNIDGIIVDCWWGIVEGWNPHKYVWSGYRELFNIIQEFNLKLQVVLAFHEHGGNASGDMLITLPKWILEIGKNNPDIFFTDRQGRRNTGYLSWGVDKERVIDGRTGVEVYFDLMRSFRAEFNDFFVEGFILGVEIGLGASGELKYPSSSEQMGWRYPGVGEFQCYDKYMMQNLQKAAKLRGHSFWARGPDNAGQYNSSPHETGFFCERGDYDSYYGRFFLHWYAQTLMDHADNILSLATLAFEDTKIIIKVPAVYWWYRTSSHAAELTAGYYNPTNQNGYSPVLEVLKKYSVIMKFACSGLRLENDEAFADPESLSLQVLNSAWDHGLSVAGENSTSGCDKEALMRIAEMAKPKNDPDCRHFSFFVYRQPSSLVHRRIGLPELDYFVKCMHGKIAGDQVS